MAKKIKLVVSDLHLGPGRYLEDGRMNLLEEFYFDEKFSEFLQFYSTGDFADAQAEIILNGDIFNFLQMDYRGHYLTKITESMTVEQMRRIINGHPGFFRALKDFASRPGNQVTFVVGNHDQGLLWPAVRAQINEVIGANVQYKNIVYFFDGIHIEHGNMHEAANRMDPRKFFLKKDLPEPILNLPFGSHFFIEFVMRLKFDYPHLDKIRPFRAFLRWSLLFQTMFTVGSMVKLLGYFFKQLFVTVDGKRRWSLKRILKILFESAVYPDLEDAAKKILRDSRVHTVIFGHTHVYQYRQFSNEQEYFNTGTWTEVTSLDVETLGRITKLTYVLIEYQEESKRPRGRLKEWRGYHRIEEDVAI
jgi:UDP-2,3-diacylglucosamine pyrophosphatase LpxH